MPTRAASTHRIKYHGLVSAPGILFSRMSRETPPRLYGSSCNYVKELTAGTNNTVFAKIEILPMPAACDPTL